MHVSPEVEQKVRGVIIVVLPLLGFLVAVVLLWRRYVFPQDLVLLGVLFTLTTMGVGTGYHRMLTHQGFDAPRWLRGLFVALGCMAWEGTPISWASTHIKHHAHSDEEEDPHSPLHGFWHAHCGWIFDAQNFPPPSEYAPHLLRDPVIVFVDRLSLLWMTLALAIPFAIGGWTGLLWGGVVRIFLTTHVTWSVNSICHTFGRRAFETTDESRNEWIVGLLGFGEGWHNNHHAFPRSAFHGLHWWQFDLNGILIGALERVGLIWNVQRVSVETIRAQQQRAYSMVASLQGLRAQVIQSVTGATQELESLFSSSIRTSLSPEEYARLVALQEDTVRRLGVIHASIARAGHLKRPRLLKYMQEVQSLLQEARAAAQERAGMLVAR